MSHMVSAQLPNSFLFDPREPSHQTTSTHNNDPTVGSTPYLGCWLITTRIWSHFLSEIPTFSSFICHDCILGPGGRSHLRITNHKHIANQVAHLSIDESVDDCHLKGVLSNHLKTPSNAGIQALVSKVSNI